MGEAEETKKGGKEGKKVDEVRKEEEVVEEAGGRGRRVRKLTDKAKELMSPNEKTKKSPKENEKLKKTPPAQEAPKKGRQGKKSLTEVKDAVMEPVIYEPKKHEENQEAVVEKEEGSGETVNKPETKKKGRKSVIIKTVPEVEKESNAEVGKKVDAKKGRRKSMAVVEDAPAKFVPTKLDEKED